MNNLDLLIAENRLIRNNWSKVENGRQLLCLWTGLANDPNSRPEMHPVGLCQPWLAYLIPWMNDKGTLDAWPAMVRRVAKLSHKFANLSDVVEWQVRAACVEKAMQYTTSLDALATCDTILIVLRKRIEVGTYQGFDEELKAACSKADAKSAAAAAAVTYDVRATIWAAVAATHEIRVEETNAWTTTCADLAALQAWAAAPKTYSSARMAAVDELIVRILDIIEAANCHFDCERED